MFTRNVLLMGVVAALVLGASCNQGSRPATGGDKKSAPVAKVGKRVITQEELDVALQSLPQFQQQQMGGARGKLRILELLENRALVLQAAEDQGLARDPGVKKQLDDLRAQVLEQAYHRRLVESQPKPTEPQIRDYYDKHPREFVVQARVNASWIKCATKKDAEAARRRIVDKHEDFATVAKGVSVDRESAKDGGLLGYFNPIGYVRSIGADKPEFQKHVFELEADDVGPVFQWEDGWAFVKVHEKTTERAEPFAKSHDSIAARLTPTFNDSLLNGELARLRDKYKVETYLSLAKELEDKSADELMRLATESPDPNDKLEYYRALLKKYPTYPRADEAQFMIGFVYSEELNDFEAAKPEYQKVLDHFPQSEIKESALYMLQNMGHGKLPSFEDTPPEAPGSQGATPEAAVKTPGTP